MKKITEALRKKGITSKALPQELRESIAKLREEILAYNAATEQYDNARAERDEDEEDDEAAKEANKKFEDLADTIAEKETELAEAIENLEKEKNDEPEPELEPKPAPATPQKKEDSSVGWLILGE